jgi:hypothetical protein
VKLKIEVKPENAEAASRRGPRLQDGYDVGGARIEPEAIETFESFECSEGVQSGLSDTWK